MSVINLNKRRIVEFLEPKTLTASLLSYLQLGGICNYAERQLIESKVTTVDQLMLLTDILARKDKGLTSLLSYFRANGMEEFAKDLERQKCELPPVTLEMFILKLARYYKKYSNVWTPHMHGQPISKVYVPLSVVEDRPRHSNVVSSNDMLQYLRNEGNPDVLLLKGDAGSGKTALLKKVAYDWAERYQFGMREKNGFSVVLYVPLQFVEKCDDLLYMAVDYAMARLKMPDVPKDNLVKELEDMGAEVLLCLDGMDDRNAAETPLKDMFAPPFKQEAKFSRIELPVFDYKVLVAARPYACESISKEMRLSVYNLTPLEDQHLIEFATNYCGKEGLEKLQAYLEKANNLPEAPIHNPLFCLLLCFLIEYDQDESILQCIPILFDRCLYHMTRWAVKQYKLAEDVDLKNEWTATNVVSATANLAAVGFAANMTKFDHKTLAENEIPDDSFVCGFLLFRFDPVWDRRSGVFLHQSVQEYFATLPIPDTRVWQPGHGVNWNQISWPISRLLLNRCNIL